MTDYNGAIWIPNNNAFVGRQGYSPRYIVLHGTAGGSSAQAIAQYFQSTQGTSSPVSANYIVGTGENEVVQCNTEADGAWSNGYISGPSGTAGDGVGNGFHDSWWSASVNPNLLTISIEHVKASIDNSNTLTPAQQAASFKLIKDICTRQGIPARKADASGGITGHYSIDPVNRALCPGPYPWDALWTFLESDNSEVLSISQANQYYIEVTPNQRWHCKLTGYDVAFAILDYYRACTLTGLNGLSQYGLPTSGEIAHPKVKGATYQRFERGVIVYDPAHADDSVPGLSGPCYPGHLDKYLPAQPVPVSVPGAITTLQAVVPQINSVITNLQGGKPS